MSVWYPAKQLFPAFLVCVWLAEIAGAATPPVSTFFSTAAEESFSTYQMDGDGDLWPSCWADDGNLYTANGDGSGFTHSGLRFDMAVSRIAGFPPRLSGTTIATNIGTNWSGHDYNRKPTGMLCVDHSIYLAFQNLNLKNFSDAPVASIARSEDHGHTWHWDETKPMFGRPEDPNSPLAYKFTTIFFLDFGRDSTAGSGSFAYAYGLDRNWREQSELYLARIPRQNVQDRDAWRFFAGLDEKRNAIWSEDLTKKAPVLVDDRKLYPEVIQKQGCGSRQATIGQGGVVYDAPLRRYIFSSWSCSTHQFYEAPEPWGPWRLFLSKDFGSARLPENRGQYGTNIPSKFISNDGKTLYVQSNVCCGGNSYTYALRKLYVEPYRLSRAVNLPSEDTLAVTELGARAISKSTRRGNLCGIDCFDSLNYGNVNDSEDDDDNEAKSVDWWGYIWPKAYRFNKLVYETGRVTAEGGWFSGNLRVQVRRGTEWKDVTGLTITPPYRFDRSLPSHTVTTFRFEATWGDGIRLIGTPGGNSRYTSIAQLAAYYDAGNLINDGGFEFQLGPSLSGVWRGKGSGAKGVTRFAQEGHSGVNNVWLESEDVSWNAVVQMIDVRPRTKYVMEAWVQTNFEQRLGRLGIRKPGSGTPLIETQFGAMPRYTRVTARFDSDEESTVEIYIGFTGDNKKRTLRVDDVSLRQP